MIMLIRRLHQSWEIRMFHWLFFVVTIIKLWTGFAISFPHPFWGFPGLYQARMAHAVMTPVLAGLLTFRLYLALLSRDWRQLLFWRRSHLQGLRSWLRYYLFLDDRPVEKEKYNALQRFLFTFIFLLMPFFYATGVIMLNLPGLRWINLFFGSQGIARIVHYLISVLLAMIVVIHIYLVITSNVERLKAMFTGYLHQRNKLEDGGDSL